ncbi:transcriptional regulator [Massilia arenosa]|uniref:Transcriptional regulator n=1 Tax=Zemynaea arenosa TaxID=2561931 RepID=A0A4Y9SGV9_9BURK|nr:metalloregulator ArsR/SmtB family transcription factor [Massilia arenosa]TFW20848.1 transcriptional regulator [Massilia arenosa]
MSTFDRVLYLLKTRGPQTAQQLANHLDLTPMGARRQLESGAEKGLIAFQDIADKVGRPARTWSLTAAGHARFPDRHADLTLHLIDEVRALFGEAGLERLISAREHATEANYAHQLADQTTVEGRAAALAAIRAAEGYMAESQPQPDGTVLLVENHCPICAAADHCRNFCRSELQVFQRVLGPDCAVERTDHILAGARRCAYRIVPLHRV